MNKLFRGMATFALLCVVGGVAQAAITMPIVNVDNKGNVADTTSYGAVGYDYGIGKYEVTAGQYTAFLNSVAKTDTYGLYNAAMNTQARGCKIVQSGVSGNFTYSVASDYANRPVNYVSYWDACRFANWLNNGQIVGSTETGAYTMTSIGITNNSIARNAGWKWAVTSENEWYKAAYYKGGSASAGYWGNPMQSSAASTPSNDITNPDAGNNANFYQNGYTIGAPYYRTNVGEFENSASAYGTFDQGGNVSEWNEAIIGGSSYRGVRGGSFSYAGSLLSTDRGYKSPTYENSDLGFRVSAVVPEPSSLIALGALVAPLLAVRRRKA